MAEEKKAASDNGGNILVIGGGISGISTAIEAAEAGYEAIIVERNPYLGGRVAQMNRYFPKLCPPYCGLEINFRRIKSNRNIQCYTQSEVEKIEGEQGDYTATVKIKPRFVNDNCTSCGRCAEVCPVERPNDFNYGIDFTKAAYLPHEMAYPMKYVIDNDHCQGERCAKCLDVCDYNAIDLNMKEETVEIKAGSIVVATGWNPYDANKIDNLGFDKYANVINNVMMERYAAPNGPTGGKIVRPSDGKAVQSIAFVQCAGSRDENHLPYCSSICCMATLKHINYLREQYPESKAFMFYIDLRAPGKYESFLNKVEEDENVELIKGKVAKITEEANKDLVVEAENAVTGEKIRQKVEMVVLATGMEPTASADSLPVDMSSDENGFLKPDPQKPGIWAAGVSRRPVDVTSSVQDATGAALRAIQGIVRR